MTRHECPREQDVLDAIDARRWPDRCDAGLRAHVAHCPVCADLGHVASLLRDDHDRWWQAASVPPATEVWWRARMRARAEAERAVSRPVLVAQVVFGVLTVALAAGVLALLGRPMLGAWSDSLGEGWRALADTIATVPSAAAIGIIPAIPAAIWLATGIWLLAVPAAIYVAIRR